MFIRRMNKQIQIMSRKYIHGIVVVVQQLQFTEILTSR